MLRELKIRNFAIIDELGISFGSGLNVLTGETGAGKSIIIGAIHLLLGDRASPDLIRTAADSAEVEALFSLSGQEGLKERLAGMGYGSDDEIVIRRTVSRSGRNRVYVNGSLATLNLLSSLSGSLVNICSQHEHQFILDAAHHIDILDEFGGLLPARAGYTSLFAGYETLKSKLDELRSLQDRKREREDFLRYQLREIREAGLKPEEDAILAEEKKILSHAQKLQDHAARAYDVLYGKEGSVLGELKSALQSIREIKNIDPSLRISPEETDSLFFQLEDAAMALRDYMKRITFDPGRLAEIEDRLDVLNRIGRKHGGTLARVLARAAEMESELEHMASLEDEMARVSGERAAMKKVLLEQAGTLSAGRRKAARSLKTAIEKEIRSLRMAEARFDVFFADSPLDEAGDPQLTEKGSDAVEFFLTTNVGEVMKPLNRIASGGELSRIVLALKKALARTGSVGTIVFDEVDSGIGGAVAEVVGEKLKDVSRHHQVLCITHLPQIACFGDRHYLVSKAVSGKRTNSDVRLLSDEERLREIARMLGGVDVTEKTREHAREMIGKAKKAKGEGAKREKD
jgi:DNA repair protein RecN (Recombination protein N)